ncbi:hypothetical protein KQI68_06900 [Peptoniphilus sp. MSJ-1]|uniref:Replicative helicase inhibitor G39P N-terminal domain-containing protein n=1 Tax=Peptoniphilus ovalis TaxID=2841503 RepID=A0ABS6FHB4_9FIRM|nr:replicative helicase loader/inhibitor [Peptoniphilus ovalis]MBU5669567.1 hypothetical protein [Peptoniphilus ovalis]
MLSKTDFIRAVEYLIAVYPEMEKTFNRQISQSVWYELLRDIDGENLLLAVKMYTTTQKFAPKPAEIREMVLKTTTEEKDWTNGWSLVLKSIGKYGIYREAEALRWIGNQDPIAEESIRRMGYKSLCESEDQAAFRANFRQAYNNQLEINKFKVQLPPDVRERMIENREKAKSELLELGYGNDRKVAELFKAIGS